jgi:hypothetical protein
MLLLKSDKERYNSQIWKIITQLKPLQVCRAKWGYTNILMCYGWSELAPTNAPVEDEPVEAVLGWTKNPILPALMDFFFPPLLYPKIFPPPTYLPPYLPPTSPSYLPPTPLPTHHLPPPSYLPPTNPSPLTPSPELQNIEWERAWSWSRSCWSRRLELGGGARSLELCLEWERDLCVIEVSLLLFFFFL